MRLLLIPLLLLLAATGDLRAQVRSVNLPDAVRMAEEESLEIKRLSLAVQRAATGVESLREEYGPEVFVEGEYRLTPQPDILFTNPDVAFNTTGEMDALVTGGHHVTGATIAARLPLYDPRRRLRLRVAESGVSVAQAELDVARASSRRNVERLFYRALYARYEKKTREDQINQAVTNLEFTLARFRQGRALPLDTVTAATTLARARASASRAGLSYQAALIQLARRIGIRDVNNLELDGSLDLPSAPGPSGGDMTVVPGILNSAELQLAQQRLAASRVAVDAEQRSIGPTIDLVGRARARGESADYTPDQWAWGMTSFVGFVARLNLTELWRGDPVREGAELRVRENQLSIDDIRREDSIAVETLLFEMQAARTQIEAEEATVEQSTRAIEITTILYREGRATWLDVETAQNRLLETELALERLKLRFLESYAELKAIGG